MTLLSRPCDLPSCSQKKCGLENETTINVYLVLILQMCTSYLLKISHIDSLNIKWRVVPKEGHHQVACRSGVRIIVAKIYHTFYPNIEFSDMPHNSYCDEFLIIIN